MYKAIIKVNEQIEFEKICETREEAIKAMNAYPWDINYDYPDEYGRALDNSSFECICGRTVVEGYIEKI
jgi:hypothetical protein